MLLEFVDRITIKRNREIDTVALCTIKEIVRENGIEREYTLNDKAIINAFKKQMPKKPVIPFDSIDQQHECPECLNWVHKPQRYCDECGQALDWSDTE